jgi:alkanesulfonate monooxygenase SsuD/methylene tetrahydromethanopterin reductase-like flavin-dependent oxidoreductase (luciferase family)
MRFGIFYEHQLPRPWSPDDEHRLLTDSLEQVELADRVGIDYVWEVEHHFLEEYSHSSAPEVFLAAASQRTRQIRLGHGIVQAPPAVNHPARIAERIATLDLISGGRVEFGTGEASSASELGAFGVPRSAKRAQWEEALDVVTRMFTETPFVGWEGTYVRMPPRNVVPKPLQKPHPPLWVACSRRDTIHLAARSGIGALSFSFVEPEDARRWVDEYYRLLGSEECMPRGFAVNPNVAVVVPMMVHPDEETAIERGIDGAHFFGYSLAHFYASTHVVGAADVWRDFVENRAAHGFAREIVRAEQAPLAVRLLQAGMGSLRGAIGTPSQVTELIQRYADAGVDQVIFVMQSGRNRHEHICESLELFGREILPRFVEGREEAEAAKADRLAPAVDKALARRSPPRQLSAPYPVNEDIEIAAARRPSRARLRDLAGEAGRSVRASTTERVMLGAERLTARASDDGIERFFARPGAQRALFGLMTRGFDPRKAAGFTGAVVYDLSLSDGSRQAWAIEIGPARARVREGAVTGAALTIRLPLVDFVKIIMNVEYFYPLILDGRMTIEGDLNLAFRLAEMFGGRSTY